MEVRSNRTGERQRLFIVPTKMKMNKEWKCLWAWANKYCSLCVAYTQIHINIHLVQLVIAMAALLDICMSFNAMHLLFVYFSTAKLNFICALCLIFDSRDIVSSMAVRFGNKISISLSLRHSPSVNTFMCYMLASFSVRWITNCWKMVWASLPCNALGKCSQEYIKWSFFREIVNECSGWN